jgi:hypothetical protein
MIRIHLSQPGKIPCKSWSLPAQECKVGSKLAKIKGSVCKNCYALRGNYRFPHVKALRYKNLDSIGKALDSNDFSEWIDAMAKSLRETSEAFFRWFDSGDLQSVEHLSAIARVAEATPNIKHWLPTHEKGMVLKYIALHKEFPRNLIVRISSAMIDGKPTLSYPLTSTVHRSLEPQGHACPAFLQGNKCGECRACWNPDIKNISYKAH